MVTVHLIAVGFISVNHVEPFRWPVLFLGGKRAVEMGNVGLLEGTCLRRELPRVVTASTV